MLHHNQVAQSLGLSPHSEEGKVYKYLKLVLDIYRAIGSKSCQIYYEDTPQLSLQATPCQW